MIITRIEAPEKTKIGFRPALELLTVFILELGPRADKYEGSAICWLLKGGVKVSSGTASLYGGSYGTDFDTSKERALTQAPK